MRDDSGVSKWEKQGGNHLDFPTLVFTLPAAEQFSTAQVINTNTKTNTRTQIHFSIHTSRCTVHCSAWHTNTNTNTTTNTNTL